MTNTTTLTLTDRPAKVADKIKTETKKQDGEDERVTHHVPITGVMIDARELDMLLGKGAHSALFRKTKDLVEPRFELLKPYALRDNFDGDVSVTIADKTIEFDGDGIALNSVKLRPQVGGFTALSLTLQLRADADETALLMGSMNREIRVELSFGGKRKPSRAQDELPMGSHEGPDDEDDADDDPAEDPADQQAGLEAEAAGNGGAAGQPGRPLLPGEDLPPGVPPIRTLRDTH